MVHRNDNDQAINPRIWQGKRAALEEKRKLYNAGKLTFVAWVSALYSFKQYDDVRKELVKLAPSILGFARTHFAYERGERLCKDTADEAGVISTVLVWLRGVMSRCYGEYMEYTDAARGAIEFGLRMTDGRGGGHTNPLLLLTKADIFLRYGTIAEGRVVLIILREAALRAQSIKDANQRSRVYRKLGMLFRKAGKRALGWHYGIRAMLVQGIPLMVRVKGLAVLAGFGN